MKQVASKVEVWDEKVTLPTYEVGKPDKNPMFLEKRVYQGSSGKVYPYPVIDKIYDQKVYKQYNVVFLENQYIKVMIMPELGGRIQRAYDKTNNYDFVYYNEVIKPALVGLVGPWISGGIEFNWPQHHRPTTFLPTEYKILSNDNGSKTLKIFDKDRINGTSSVTSFTLYPDKSYIEITGQVYNSTSLPQTFLWWANPAVAVNDNTQSIFPPDVHAVFDHGKRAVSKFPIATGEYYKHDYGTGVDISRYKNLPVPTSYMAYKSNFNFMGGYDYGVEAGVLHIADHHVSPGKKQWTWGCGDFGKAWDRNLTDNNGPYIELMTGMFCDNQPDFTWLMPSEEKKFTQYFMPYKKVGNVKNASIEVVLNLDFDEENANICVYATSKYEKAKIVLSRNGKAIYKKEATISPVDILTDSVKVNAKDKTAFTLSVYDNTGRLMLDYSPLPEKINKIPEPAKPAKQPEEIMTNEELYLTGLHIEQYRHATYLPDPYYLEGLKRDPADVRINIAYGELLLRRGVFDESEKYFRTAIERLTEMTPNPYTGKAHLNLGLTLMYQGRDDEAFDAFYKATWNSDEQAVSFYYMAALAVKKGNITDAYDYIERSIIRNSHSVKARGLKAVILRALGKEDEAEKFINESISINPFDFQSMIELAEIKNTDIEQVIEMIINKSDLIIDVALLYAVAGMYNKAVTVLKKCVHPDPLIKYYLAYFYGKLSNKEMRNKMLAEAAASDSAYCFPSKLTDILVLVYAIKNNNTDSYAPYYLGNLYYDKRQFEKAISLWESSVKLNEKFPTAWRNLSLGYYNKQSKYSKAEKAMKNAFLLDTTDARIFLETDQLNKKMGMTPENRLKFYETYKDTFVKRDDLMVEYITLLNISGKYKQAYDCIMNHKFHPWEGGEGRILTQYTTSLLQLGRIELASGNVDKAINYLEDALKVPQNLGEGKLEGTKDNNVYYFLGCAYEKAGNIEKAKECWNMGILGQSEPASMMYYNDQPADMIMYQGLSYAKLGNTDEAKKRFNRLVDYGEKHIFDEVKIDYFAVSLPDLQLFDEDLSVRNKAYCSYLIALGNYGLGNKEKAIKYCQDTLDIDCAHIGAIQHIKMFSND